MLGVLVVLSGLPGTGKTAVAKALASASSVVLAVHLRIDTIEAAIMRSGRNGAEPVGALGYDVAYALAEDHLRQGLTVIADAVNPLAVSREQWRVVAARAGARCIEVEVRCSDKAEHRRRVRDRTTDVPGLTLPSWQDVQDRRYEAWDRPVVVLDTAERDVQDCVAELRRHVEQAWRLP